MSCNRLLQPQNMVLEPTVKSLLIKMRFDGKELAIGTGFVVNAPRGPVLITNRHNLTGRDQNTGKPLLCHGGIPDEVIVMHNSETFGEWIPKLQPLLDQKGEPLWFEHPLYKSLADFVALPLSNSDKVKLYPYTLGIGDPAIIVQPAEVVSVVGFPFGKTAGGYFAIWATGFLATDFNIDYNGLPVFLIDCRSRKGQSGSAVIAHRSGGAIATETGTMITNSTTTRFLGIYSGRINKESDLGMVWKAKAIQELVNGIPN